MQELLARFAAPDRLAGTLSLLRWVFCGAAVLVVLRVCFHFAPYRIGHRLRMMLFPVAFAVAAAAILLYQATWQLSGYVHRDFVRFMERYNPRPDNAARHLVRGAILDRNGAVLARTQTDGPALRLYPYERAAAHLVGYRDPKRGLVGIERAADAVLSGYRELEKPEDFAEAAKMALRDVRPVGTNLVLTVDARLQLVATALLAGRPGAAVALDPKTGEVLLLCSSPSFDPNRFDPALNADPARPLLNRAVSGTYPPGSTFKTAIAALMAQNGLGGVSYDCPAAGYKAPGTFSPIHDHEYYSWKARGAEWPGFGRIGMDKALAKSSNTFFAQGGVACGPAAFNEMAAKLHFNEGIVLYADGASSIGSRRGSVTPLARAEFAELSQRSIGQGTMAVTPLHMAMLVSAIANGGTLMRPHLDRSETPEVLDRPFSEAAARRVRSAMREVVASPGGTGHKADLPGLEVCGKTGTAQNPLGGDHAWFVCFAPASDPRIAVAVIVENAGFGSREALPVATGILEAWFAGHPLDDPSPPPSAP